MSSTDTSSLSFTTASTCTPNFVNSSHHGHIHQSENVIRSGGSNGSGNIVGDSVATMSSTFTTPTATAAATTVNGEPANEKLKSNNPTLTVDTTATKSHFVSPCTSGSLQNTSTSSPSPLIPIIPLLPLSPIFSNSSNFADNAATAAAESASSTTKSLSLSTNQTSHSPKKPNVLDSLNSESATTSTSRSSAYQTKAGANSSRSEIGRGFGLRRRVSLTSLAAAASASATPASASTSTTAAATSTTRESDAATDANPNAPHLNLSFPEFSSPQRESPVTSPVPSTSASCSATATTMNTSSHSTTQTPQDTHSIPASHESVSEPTEADRIRAFAILTGQDETVSRDKAAAWLGERGALNGRVRQAYVELFDWRNCSILYAFRDLCSRLTLKGESQQLDRVIDAFARRWCACNVNHGFRCVDVVHTIAYSLLMLNTDLHIAEIEQKMTRGQFVKNTLPTIRSIALDSASVECAPPFVSSRPPTSHGRRVSSARLWTSSGKAHQATANGPTTPVSCDSVYPSPGRSSSATSAVGQLKGSTIQESATRYTGSELSGCMEEDLTQASIGTISVMPGTTTSDPSTSHVRSSIDFRFRSLTLRSGQGHSVNQIANRSDRQSTLSNGLSPSVNTNSLSTSTSTSTSCTPSAGHITPTAPVAAVTGLTSSSTSTLNPPSSHHGNSGSGDLCLVLVRSPWDGTLKGWEGQIELVLREFYNSIRSQRLPLHDGLGESNGDVNLTDTFNWPSSGSSINGLLLNNSSTNPRTGNSLRGRKGGEVSTFRSMTARLTGKTKSRTRLLNGPIPSTSSLCGECVGVGGGSVMASSCSTNSGSGERASLEENRSSWGPVVERSSWTRYTLGKAKSRMSMESLIGMDNRSVKSGQFGCTGTDDNLSSRYARTGGNVTTNSSCGSLLMRFGNLEDTGGGASICSNDENRESKSRRAVSCFGSKNPSLINLAGSSVTPSLPSPSQTQAPAHIQSIGFAHALSQVMTRSSGNGGGGGGGDDGSANLSDTDNGDNSLGTKRSSVGSLSNPSRANLDDEVLELAGPPWVKEGILQYRYCVDGGSLKNNSSGNHHDLGFGFSRRSGANNGNGSMGTMPSETFTGTGSGAHSSSSSSSRLLDTSERLSTSGGSGKVIPISGSFGAGGIGTSGVLVNDKSSKKKDKGWTQVFGVVEKGWFRLFSFSSSSNSSDKSSHRSLGNSKSTESRKFSLTSTSQSSSLRKSFFLSSSASSSTTGTTNTASSSSISGSGSVSLRSTTSTSRSLINLTKSSQMNHQAYMSSRVPTPPISQVSSADNSPRVVGGGNWLKNATLVAKFLLRHTMASALPPPGFSANRPYVWALTLPSGAVHLFQGGTPEIVQEWVTTVNYWSARYSKEPLMGGVSNVEYGWSETLLSGLYHHDSNGRCIKASSSPMTATSENVPLSSTSSVSDLTTSHTNVSSGGNLPATSNGGGDVNVGSISKISTNPSISLTASSKLSGSWRLMVNRNPASRSRPNAFITTLSSSEPPAKSLTFPSTSSTSPSTSNFSSNSIVNLDNLIISQWTPPAPSMMACTESETEQCARLERYVAQVEKELAQHNALRERIIEAFARVNSSSVCTSTSAMATRAYSPSASASASASASTSTSTSTTLSTSTPSSPHNIMSLMLMINKHGNAVKAMTNWERKGAYLLRQIVKFRTYIDSLKAAREAREALLAKLASQSSSS